MPARFPIAESSVILTKPLCDVRLLRISDDRNDRHSRRRQFLEVPGIDPFVIAAGKSKPVPPRRFSWCQRKKVLDIA
jgi:hypothetical protein